MDKYNSIFVDGIDRCGKNTVVKYIQYLSNHRYMVYDRGILSNITYARMFNRNIQYDLDQYKPFVFVYLVCDEDDWTIRCKLTNEPKIDYRSHIEQFDITSHMLENVGFNIMFFNTSHMTPYDIAKNVLIYVDKLNKGLK